MQKWFEKRKKEDFKTDLVNKPEHERMHECTGVYSFVVLGNLCLK